MITLCTNTSCPRYHLCWYGCCNDMYAGLKKFGTQKRLGEVVEVKKDKSTFGCFRSNINELAVEANGCSDGVKYLRKLKNLSREDQIRRAAKIEKNTGYLVWLTFKNAWTPSRPEVEEIEKVDRELAIGIAPWFYKVSKVKAAPAFYLNISLTWGKDRFDKLADMNMILSLLDRFGHSVWDGLCLSDKCGIIECSNYDSSFCKNDEIFQLAKYAKKQAIWLAAALDGRVSTEDRLIAVRNISNAFTFKNFIDKVDYDFLKVYLERNK